MVGYLINIDDFDTKNYNLTLKRYYKEPFKLPKGTEIELYECPAELKEEAILAYRPGRLEQYRETLHLWCFNDTNAYLRGTEQGYDRAWLSLNQQGEKCF